ncbi:type II toxin-antitoxin system RelE/ParE family toxin [Ochrobactrum quorumnocens]|uniref:type II toxin-antitoxin system RelE/ParE family toxin n=1 Tax=Ochrobactrum quorumnocens TaxID=271865 RepID=UPI001F2DDA4C|nr:type II toxin-antitoxin system RelE/ParE family toxin [[Ochrobactrum] quorumnocens]
MTLFIRPAAQADLIEIGDYIAIDNPDRALSFIAEFEALIFSAIAVRPDSFPARPDLGAKACASRAIIAILSSSHTMQNASKCCVSCMLRVPFSPF